MKGDEKNYYRTRFMDDIFGDEISDSRRRDERKYDDLVAMIFGQKRATYGSPREDDDQETRLAREFYGQFYQEPRLKYG